MIEASLTLQEAAARLHEAVERARSRGESTLLTDGGEPVARVVPVEGPCRTMGALADWWASHERLDSEEAAAFAADLSEIRRAILPPSDPWA
jgi:prevent-host-death family protein